MTPVALSPLLPLWIIIPVIILGLCAALYMCAHRVKGALPRVGVFIIGGLWLLNPVMLHPVYKAVDLDIAVIMDTSPSMKLAHREAEEQSALTKIKKAASDLPGFHLHVIRPQMAQSDDTRLFAALSDTSADLHHFAGAILVTDGMVHDVPPTLPSLFAPDAYRGQKPLDVILTGQKEEVDRHLEVLEAPAYGIVGKDALFKIRVSDQGTTTHLPVDVTVQAGNQTPRHLQVESGKDATFSIHLDSAGDLPIFISAAPLKNEVSTRNNFASLRINGIRERLKVLLISGTPNPGERVWRRLLRSDPAVDLVHFTILRTPEQDDGTPSDEMALVVFPTQELFEKKIDQFDLIILDGFKTMGLLPEAYMSNIAHFVRNGGGLLLITGPEFLEDGSLRDSPLSGILPATVEDGGVINQKFVPQMTATGHRHPVMNTLPQPWGPWYRALKVVPASIKGQVVLDGPKDQPLLILNDVAKGRVAMLLSDQIWLWSRGEDGGGPQAQLLRRLAHWLMKEPGLDAERLTATVSEGRLTVTRFTLQPELHTPALITKPDGTRLSMQLFRVKDGEYKGQIDARSDPGIWRIQQGKLETAASPDISGSKEDEDLRATASRLAPLVRQSHGHIIWSGNLGSDFRFVSEVNGKSAQAWGFPAGRIIDQIHSTKSALIPTPAGLAAILTLVFLAWWRERKN